MADKKKYKLAYPHEVLGASEGVWPEIGPGPTELSATEYEKASEFATANGMRLEEVDADEPVVDSTGRPAEAEPAEPRPSDSTQVWRTYAEGKGLDVPADANRTQIQSIVASAKNGE